MACQHSLDDQTLRLQAGAGEDDVIHLPSGVDRVDCERQEEVTVFGTCKSCVNFKKISRVPDQNGVSQA